MTPSVIRSRIRKELQALALARGPHKTLCPSEVVRRLAADPRTPLQDWRSHTPTVREVAAELADQGQLLATQGSVPVHPLKARGPIRLGLPRPGGPAR